MSERRGNVASRVEESMRRSEGRAGPAIYIYIYSHGKQFGLKQEINTS